MKTTLLLIVIILSPIAYGFSQNFILSGKVVDAESKEPLAFVNIIYGANHLGTTTGIDGNFKIQSPEKLSNLKFSYLGYEPLEVIVTDLWYEEQMLVMLESKAFNIDEVVVLPGENPAHRIINNTIENRDINNPEKMTSFSYTSYNKMHFSVKMDSGSKSDSISYKAGTQTYTDTLAGMDNDPSKKIDTSVNAEIKKQLSKFHLMMMESVSQRQFISPDKNKETVIASRVSGLKDASYSVLATQLQSFSFYPENITIYEKSYINPISKGSTRKYFFLIKDTLYTKTKDTVFIISYRPKKGKNFDGLKGILHINTNKYAIQSVIAEPYHKQNVGIKVQQNYEYIEGKQWFPVQLNTDISFNNLKVGTGNGSGKMKIVGIGKSYLKDISLNPELSRKKFNNIDLFIEDDAHKKTDEFWSSFRVDSLTLKEKNTYHVIDSLGEEMKLDRLVKAMEILAVGSIPVKFINLPVDQLINFNEYEGFRLGLGIMTNQRLAKWFSVGGYFAYGFRDQDIKYGAQLDFNLHKHSEFVVSGKYKNDVLESAGYKFLEDNSIISSEFYRPFMIKNMDKIEEIKFSIELRLLQYIKFQVFASQTNTMLTENYLYDRDINDTEQPINNFVFTEAGIKIKYAHKEKFINTTFGKYSLGTNYPVIWANVSRGLNMIDGEYEYTRIEAKISKKFTTKALGKTYLQVQAGYVDGNVPYPKLYNGHGSYQTFTVATDNSFNTMRMNEFLSDRFVYIFFKHDFGKLLFRTDKFKPEIALVNHIGFGTLSNKERHLNYDFKTMEHGYYECGILINNILRQSFIGIGGGVYYRYGAYTKAETIDNFAFRITFSLSL